MGIGQVKSLISMLSNLHLLNVRKRRICMTIGKVPKQRQRSVMLLLASREPEFDLIGIRNSVVFYLWARIVVRFSSEKQKGMSQYGDSPA